LEKTAAIELKNITKTFGAKVIANKNVCLTANHGEILSILGENGSGKTTLMNMISGIYFPDEGQIFIGGEELTQAYALDTDGDFVPDTEEAVFDGAYHESYFQSAPYFAMDIDGITLLN
jgi:ABC-type sugar transport system ATPase subunit